MMQRKTQEKSTMILWIIMLHWMKILPLIKSTFKLWEYRELDLLLMHFSKESTSSSNLIRINATLSKHKQSLNFDFSLTIHFSKVFQIASSLICRSELFDSFKSFSQVKVQISIALHSLNESFFLERDIMLLFPKIQHRLNPKTSPMLQTPFVLFSLWSL